MERKIIINRNRDGVHKKIMKEACMCPRLGKHCCRKQQRMRLEKEVG